MKVVGKLKTAARKKLIRVGESDAKSMVIAQSDGTGQGISLLADSVVGRILHQGEFAGTPLLELVFYIAWALLVVSELVLRYNYSTTFSVFSETLVDLLHGAAFFLLGIKVLVSRYSGVCQVVVILVLGGVAISTSLYSNTLTMLGIFMLLVASQGVSFNRVALIQTVILATGVVIGIFLWRAGWLLDDSALRIEGDPTSLMRHSLGFKHPNMLATLLLFIACSFTAYRGMNISLLHLVMYVLLGIFTYFVTGSRTAAGMIIFLVVLCMLWKVRKLRPLLPPFVVIALLLGIVFSLYLMVNFDWAVRWQEVINNILSQRCNFMNQYYEVYGISVFGAGFAPPSDMPLDNAYARLLLQNGLIPFVIFIVLIAASIVMGMRKKWAYPYLLIFCYLGCFGVMEYYIFSILNFSLLFIPAMLYGRSHDRVQ